MTIHRHLARLATNPPALVQNASYGSRWGDMGHPSDLLRFIIAWLFVMLVLLAFVVIVVFVHAVDNWANSYDNPRDPW